jgi:hypothetical protein
MTQYGYEPLSPDDSGSTLLERMNGVVPALLTNHKGAVRPGYVQPGMMWVDDSGATWLLKLFDGVADATLASIDPATHALVDSYLKIDGSQTLSVLQQTAIRLALGVPSSALAGTKASKRNRIVNSAIQVCQDRATGASIVFNAGTGYAFDGVYIATVGGGALTVQQVLKTSPGGSPYRVRCNASTADAAIAAGDTYSVAFPIEGIDVADLMFGTANAKSFTWRGVVNLPAGTYGLSFRNAAGTRSYVTMFTITTGGVDTLITATVPGDTSGTWIADSSGIGIWAHICFACGATWQTATAGAWAAGNFLATAAQTNGMATVNAIFEVCDIGLYEGTELPAWDRPDFSDDLRKCQRYYQAFTVSLRGYAGFGGEELGVGFAYPVVMRTYPASLGLGSGAHGNVSNFDLQGMTQNSARLRVFAAASGDVYVLDKLAILSARL